jgi:NAD(P)-dependent dehydrogenase (short-subunit alcohol dehydrogenase family)
MSDQIHSGRVALVTGAARGFGRAISEGLAARGADIVAVDIADCTATKTVVENLDRKALVVRADITDPAAVADVGQQVRQAYGRCDILVNNAGIYPACDFSELDFDMWRRVLAVNLDSQFLMAKATIELMKAQGRGRIINLTSNSLAVAVPGLSHYMASKAGVIGFTRGLATDVAPYGVTVNAVGPTATRDEDDPSGLAQEMVTAVAAMQAIKRPGTFGDIVGAVSFLASDDADFLTGQTIMVDGGLARL